MTPVDKPAEMPELNYVDNKKLVTGDLFVLEDTALGVGRRAKPWGEQGTGEPVVLRAGIDGEGNRTYEYYGFFDEATGKITPGEVKGNGWRTLGGIQVAVVKSATPHSIDQVRDKALEASEDRIEKQNVIGTIAGARNDLQERLLARNSKGILSPKESLEDLGIVFNCEDDPAWAIVKNTDRFVDLARSVRGYNNYAGEVTKNWSGTATIVYPDGRENVQSIEPGIRSGGTTTGDPIEGDQEVTVLYPPMVSKLFSAIKHAENAPIAYENDVKNAETELYKAEGLLKTIVEKLNDKGEDITPEQNDHLSRANIMLQQISDYRADGTIPKTKKGDWLEYNINPNSLRAA